MPRARRRRYHRRVGEATPLDYATVQPHRRGRVLCAFLAYLVAAYGTGISAIALLLATNSEVFTRDARVLVFALHAPLWLPPMALWAAVSGEAEAITLAWLFAFVALFVLAYRHFRKPRGG